MSSCDLPCQAIRHYTAIGLLPPERDVGENWKETSTLSLRQNYLLRKKR